MIQAFSDYSVEIKNLKYLTDSGKRFPKTAIIHFSLPGKAQPVVEIMGYIDQEDIFGMIERGEEIDLSHSYINKLSLSEYRLRRKLDPRQHVEIKNFRAENCFIDSATLIDLSFGDFTGDEVSFEGSIVGKGEFSFNNSIFKCTIFNFSYLHLSPGKFDLSNARFQEVEILFKNTIFRDGKKDFQYTDFGTGIKNFTNTEFGDGDVSFINTHFNDGQLSFKVARFGKGRVDFHFAKFGNGDKSFERAEFGDGGVDFRTVEFGHGRINFNRCLFGEGDISFEGCDQGSGKFSFKRARLESGEFSFELAEMEDIELSFDRTNFGKNTICFYNGKFGSLSFQQCHLDHYTDLRVRKCSMIDLSNTIVRDIIDLKPFEFEEDIGIIYFGGIRLIGRIYIDWKKNKVYRLIKDQVESDEELKAEQFRTLKENFNVCGQYNDEDLSYLQFKRHEERALLKKQLNAKKLNFLWAYPAHILKLIILDRAGHYATNPARVIVTMLSTLTFFSFLYFLLIITGAGNIVESVNHLHVLNALGTGFYHSAITFFTIGYGDYYPEGIIRWMSGLEGFTGVFLMAYFTVAFVRKILR